jgi:hypothetical protein
VRKNRVACFEQVSPFLPSPQARPWAGTGCDCGEGRVLSLSPFLISKGTCTFSIRPAPPPAHWLAIFSGLVPYLPLPLSKRSKNKIQHSKICVSDIDSDNQLQGRWGNHLTRPTRRPARAFTCKHTSHNLISLPTPIFSWRAETPRGSAVPSPIPSQSIPSLRSPARISLS